ncbi:ski-like [Crotalus adamanteus]|uniref:Ski-like n=1 Tax=Crotalus adamanteus TaxID=8729 RepID=A0AAW1BGH2_CROAD
MKEKFSTKNQKIPQSKAGSHYNVEFQQWYPVIKQEADSTDQPHSFIHPSYFFYMCDKVVAPNALTDGIGSDDDKGKMMEDVIKTYIKQQEKLHTILQKKQHLQMEVEMLSSSKAMKELTEEQQNLQKELESLQTEHAQRMQEFYVEQRDLEKKLEQVIKQKCTCDSSLEKDKEAEYAAQLAELRQRLDHAEADRQELQDELRQEREARQKLEKMIKELKLQIQKSSKNGKGK